MHTLLIYSLAAAPVGWAHVRQGEQWLLCDDSIVRAVQQPDVATSWTIAFYKRGEELP